MGSQFPETGPPAVEEVQGLNHLTLKEFPGVGSIDSNCGLGTVVRSMRTNTTSYLHQPQHLTHSRNQSYLYSVITCKISMQQVISLGGPWIVEAAQSLHGTGCGCQALGLCNTG